MNLKSILKLFTLAFVFIMLSVPLFAEDKIVNSLSQIVVEKPYDNSYQLGLYFKDRFQGNAFLQKRSNGSFYVYIPDTVIASKNIKVIYKKKVSKSDVSISIEEQPFIKEDIQSKYIRLSVVTPVNSDIQLVAQQMEETTSGGSFMSIYSIIIAVLLAITGILAVSIFRAMKSIENSSNSYTSFPSEFLNSPQSYVRNTKDNVTFERPKKLNSDSKIISPISTNDFSCFDLPLKKEEEQSVPLASAITKPITSPSLDDRTVQSKITNPLKRQISASNSPDLELPTAEDRQAQPVQQKEEEIYRPELVSELKIAPNKGFYLTTVGSNSFALFGYIGEKIFFLQKFEDLTQINLQARFYDKKDNSDLYIVRLDSYKAMLAVTNDDIKELAVI